VALIHRRRPMSKVLSVVVVSGCRGVVGRPFMFDMEKMSDVLVDSCCVKLLKRDGRR
jgi:hypothetical protein